MSPKVFMVDVAAADAAEPASGWAGTIQEVSPGTPSLQVTDLGAQRGDGIFETLGVVAGYPQAVETHMARFAESARLLDLPAPNQAQWRDAIRSVAARLTTTSQWGIKTVLTRGVEGTGVPTGWIAATDSGSEFPLRTAGLRVVTLDRGYPSDAAQRAPWLLPGAKTLSYAVNMAALREARRRGADGAIFVTSDGFVMEAPQSSVILRRGNRIVTPRTDIGILLGTSQLSVFALVAEWGFETAEKLVPTSQLRDSDGVWLLSSVQLATPVTRVDEADIAVDRDLTDRLNAALLARRD
ncbi:aminotransferase class IV [Gryllotalpicola sp.]|uniref:aminotransferase class IV n=1 Tax=Gryllotalpicola sp. TaxID=1932787 RepID=UPI00341D312A